VTEEGKQELKKNQTIASKWGWYRVMYALAMGDVTKMGAVELISINEAFTFLSYETDVNLSKAMKI
jgi:hypothetical protein|tara:strand:+ start:951 stop:1148 length:198 start_codon:yes stop_codon:yes gene_type:complete